MSMYDRQERKISFGLNRTPARVGPGCYDLDKDTAWRSARGQAFNTAFNTSAPLGTDLALDPSIPGPIYKPRIGDWNSKHDRVVGGRALHNKAQRFVYKANDMPGPGTYDIMKKSKWLEKGAVSFSPTTVPPPAAEPVNVFVEETDVSKASQRNTVLKPHKPRQVPSIPDRNQTHGYSIKRDGNLILNTDPDWMGPTIYRGELPKFKTQKYHGCKFGARTSRRDINWAGPSGPAPNTYSPSVARRKNHITTQPLLASAWGMRGPGQARPGRRMKSDTPAPNAYDIRGDIQAGAGLNWDEVKNNAPFACAAKRFVYKYNDFPGPGAYDVTGGGVGEGRTVNSLGFTDKRFGAEEEATPGPSDYEQPMGVTDKAAKDAELLGAPHGAFGISQGRDFDLSSKEETPAPNAYHLKQAKAGPQEMYTRRLTSSFADRTPKGFDARHNAGYGTPAPNHYSAAKSFNDTNRTTYAKARTKEGKQRQSTFIYCDKRFRSVKNDVPAPCTYDPLNKCECMPKGRFITHDEKLKPLQAQCGPGPAYLVTRGNVGVPPTFNATLGYA